MNSVISNQFPSRSRAEGYLEIKKPLRSCTQDLQGYLHHKERFTKGTGRLGGLSSLMNQERKAGSFY